jgi:putative ATP-dependent endonuclease of OLD family
LVLGLPIAVLALFHAFSDAFKGGAVLGIEEPELYLHPHAQRSLMEQFEGIVAAGNQLFISSHSAIFLDIARSDRIVLVERCDDEQQSFCTQVHTVTTEALVNARKKLHPGAERPKAHDPASRTKPCVLSTRRAL